MNTPIGRDFKRRPRSNGWQASPSRPFLAGLAIGLAVAAGVYVSQQRIVQRLTAELDNPSRPEPRPAAAQATETSDGADASATEQGVADYDFYKMLPKSEVVIPQSADETTPPPLPNAPIERPGVYVLELGSYRALANAESMRAKLARLGVEASIQRVTVGVTEIHRVRIGPISDLAALNQTRATLRAVDIDVLVIRVGD